MNKELKDGILANRLKTSTLNGWYHINPSFADILLSLNVANYRSLNKETVKQYAMDMKAGKWKKNGEPIIINKNGILNDGQTRLHAVIESGAEIDAYIIFDADDTKLYDTGVVRSAITHFRAEGKPVYSLDNSTGKAIMGFGCGNARAKFGSAVLHDWVYDHIVDIKKATSIVSTRGRVGKKAACGAVVYAMLKNKEMSETDLRMFFTVVNTGNNAGCTKDASSALVLRKQLMEAFGGGFANQKFQLEATYRALKDFKNNITRSRAYSGNENDAERMIVSLYNEDPIAA